MQARHLVGRTEPKRAGPGRVRDARSRPLPPLAMLRTSRPWLRAAFLALVLASHPGSAEARQDFPTGAVLADMLGFLVADGETPGHPLGCLAGSSYAELVRARILQPRGP